MGQKIYVVEGEEIIVDDELNITLNDLAAKFYSIQGYESKPNFDFSTSQHPQEQSMYLMALTAYLYNLNVGL